MRKSGFTLAEVLVTLAVIGVVAALTMPSLVGNYQKTKVGPSVRKFMTTIENANEHILGDKSVARISDAASTSNEYIEVLSNYLSGSTVRKEGETIMTLNDLETSPKQYIGNAAPADMDMSAPIFNFNAGDSFAVSLLGAEQIKANKENTRGSYKGKVATLYYDLNGFGTKPNRLGKDIFIIHVDNNGMTLAEGGSQLYNAYTDVATEDPWNTSEDDLCNEDKVSTGNSCAGSVADNGWKVIYKY